MTMKILIVMFFIVMPLISYAEPTKIGSWQVDVSEDKSYVYASTTNESGSVFGQFCFVEAKSCVYLVGTDTPCTMGKKSPSLANTNAGAVVYELLCDEKTNNNNFRYLFTDFDSIDKLARLTLKVGFAIPLEGDQFKVVRFQLIDAVTALNFMREVVDEMISEDEAPEPENKNEYL
jgi:hypothetical protein